MKISVVSPCHVSDTYCLPDFFNDLGKQSRLPDEVVVYIQPMNGIDFNPYQYISESVNVQIITSETPTVMGYNKNRAIEHTSGDIVCLMDIDDRIHSDKLKIVENFFKSNQECDVLLHSYRKNDMSILANEYTDASNFTKLEYENIHSGYGVIKPTYPLHYAHCSINKSVWNEFKFKESDEFFRRDDSQFIKDCYLKNKNIYCLDLELINFVK